MKTKSTLQTAAALLLAVHSQLPMCFAQGTLTPPGAPGPTMKSLDQIEPRKAISSAPFSITTSGSYYLTTNLVVDGIYRDEIQHAVKGNAGVGTRGSD